MRLMPSAVPTITSNAVTQGVNCGLKAFEYIKEGK